MITFEQFKAEWLGRRVDYDHVYAYQCVDLILEFIKECAGVPNGVSGNAIDYANKPTAAFVNATVRVTDGSRVPGDILVFSGTGSNVFGHIALRDDNLDMMLEQNGFTGNGNGTGKDAIGVYRTIPTNRLVAVFRIRQFIVTPSPAPALAAATGDTSGFTVGDIVTVTNPVDVHGTHLATSGEYEVSEIDNGSIVINRGGAIIARILGSNLNKVRSASIPTPPQAPVAPTPPANDRYVRFPSPLTLWTNKQPTKTWDLSATTWKGFKDDKDLDINTELTVVGKYEHPLGGVYFMTAEQFGNADQTGSPALDEGINTVDLTSTAPTPPAPTPAPAVAPATPATPATGEGNDAVNIPVTVKSWKDSFDASVAGKYKATADSIIHDLDGKLADVNLGHDQTVNIAGKVTKDGQDFYITEKSYEAKNWYGIPKGILVKSAATVNANATKPTVVNDIDKIAEEIKNDPEFQQYKSKLSPRGKFVADVAEAEDVVVGVFDKLNPFKGKNK